MPCAEKRPTVPGLWVESPAADNLNENESKNESEGNERTMRRLTQIIASLLSIALLGIGIAASAPHAGAAEPRPDATLVATFDGALRLSPDNVTLADQRDLAPGDRSSALLLFRNESGRTVEFALRDIIDRLENGDQSHLLLSGLDVEISFDDDLVYAGSYDKALGRSSSWFPAAPGEELPLSITWVVRPDSGNQYQGMAFLVDYLFQVRESGATVSVGDPPAKGLPKTGDRTLVWGLAALLALAAVIGFLCRRRNASDEKRES